MSPSPTTESGASRPAGNDPPRIGKKLKKLRQVEGMCQGHLARLIGTDRRQISRYENGHVTPSLDVLVRFAGLFDVSLDYLVFDDAPRRPRFLSDRMLEESLAEVHSLPFEDRAWVLEMLRTAITHHRMRQLLRGGD